MDDYSWVLASAHPNLVGFDQSRFPNWQSLLACFRFFFFIISKNLISVLELNFWPGCLRCDYEFKRVFERVVVIIF